MLISFGLENAYYNFYLYKTSTCPLQNLYHDSTMYQLSFYLFYIPVNALPLLRKFVSTFSQLFSLCLLPKFSREFCA